jgi:hypothetical protein
MIVCTMIVGGMLFVGTPIDDAYHCVDHANFLRFYTTTSNVWQKVPHLSGVEMRDAFDHFEIRGCCDEKIVSIGKGGIDAVIPIVLESCPVTQ